MARTEQRTATAAAPAAGATPALIRWGAVMGGGVIGLSLLVLLTALWLALAFGTGVGAVEANLDWFMAVSAVVAMFVGGMLAGWLAGVPGFAPGMFNGLTVWGVILAVSLLVGAPGFLQTMGVPTEAAIGAMGAQALWAGFVAMVIGALAAAIGGGLGGATTRPAFVYAAAEPATRPAPAHAAGTDGNGDPRAKEPRAAEPRPEETAEAETAETEEQHAASRAGQAREEAPANGGSARGRR